MRTDWINFNIYFEKFDKSQFTLLRSDYFLNTDPSLKIHVKNSVDFPNDLDQTNNTK